MVLRTFEADKESYDDFKSLCAKENVHVGDKINEFIKEYNKIHGDGNPAYTLDQFVDNPGMKAVPAFFRNREDWQIYIENLPEKEAQELLWQSQTINSLADKKVNHGTTNVRYH